MIIGTFPDEERRLARYAIEACNSAYNCDLKLERGNGDKSRVWIVVGDDMLVTPKQTNQCVFCPYFCLCGRHEKGS